MAESGEQPRPTVVLLVIGIFVGVFGGILGTGLENSALAAGLLGLGGFLISLAIVIEIFSIRSCVRALARKLDVVASLYKGEGPAPTKI